MRWIQKEGYRVPAPTQPKPRKKKHKVSVRAIGAGVFRFDFSSPDDSRMFISDDLGLAYRIRKHLKIGTDEAVMHAWKILRAKYRGERGAHPLPPKYRSRLVAFNKKLKAAKAGRTDFRMIAPNGMPYIISELSGFKGDVYYSEKIGSRSTTQPIFKTFRLIVEHEGETLIKDDEFAKFIDFHKRAIERGVAAYDSRS